MTETPAYVEESFGILTDDDLYLDTIMVKPANAADEDIKVIRVWVPKFPLTKSSVITCARREVESYGPDSKIANVVFDLRGTGDSDGIPGDQSFHIDLKSVAAWAEERFGRVNFGFFGFPISEKGRVYMWPLRSGTVMESYFYPASSSELVAPTILYLSTYGNFSRSDDAVCTGLADAGYDVYGLDPFRYLLHASANKKLTPSDLWEDMELLVQMLPRDPLIIGQPLAAGLGLLWAANNERIGGVIGIGRSQAGLAPPHIFDTSNPHAFFLPRLVGRIAPRPVAVVMQPGHPMGGDKKRIAALYQSLQDPRRLERSEKINAAFLLELINWLRQNKARKK